MFVLYDKSIPALKYEYTKAFGNYSLTMEPFFYEGLSYDIKKGNKSELYVKKEDIKKIIEKRKSASGVKVNE